MCDSVDGSTTFAAIFCCNAINKIFGKTVTDDLFFGFDSDAFLTNSDPEFIVDACLMALTVMSYILPERKDLVKIFTKTMEINVAELLERKPIGADFNHISVARAVIMRSRLSLLLGYYGDLLFV
jgi:hypothetical protein